MKVIATREHKKFYQDADKVIKVFDAGFKKSDILNEAHNQACVEESGLPVAKIYETRQVDGNLAIVMDLIKGKTLQQLMEENSDKEDQYLERFVDLQLKMHTYRAPMLNKLKDKMDRKIDAAALSPEIKYELHNHLAAMPKHNKLCHGDYNPSNVIVGDDGVDYIIDWSHATQGNASADVARTYLLFRLKKQDDLAEKYVRTFCQKSGTDRSYVDKWIPIVSASQYAKAYPEEKDFLLQWVENLVDFE